MQDNRKTKPIFVNQGTPLRTRVLLLILAGVLLLGGTYLWVTALRQKEEQQPLVASGEKAPVVPAVNKAATRPPQAAPVPAGGQPPARISGVPQAAPQQPAVSPQQPLVQAASGRPGAPPAPVPAATTTGRLPVPAAPTASQLPVPAAPTASRLPAPATQLRQGPAGVSVAGVPATTAGVTPAAVPGRVSDLAAGARAGAPGQAPGLLSVFVPKSIPSTGRAEAAVAARAHAGKVDPYAPLADQLKPFPRGRAGAESVSAPPLEVAKASPAASSLKLVPPPPGSGPAIPAPPGAMGDGGLSVAELPAPPARPSISEKMKLLGIIGDRAILAFSDRSLVHENKWPSTVTLGSGEQFESVKVVAVGADSVTIEEEGERSVKTIAPVK